MKILIVGNYKYKFYAKAIFDAFKKTDNDVKSFKLDEFNYKGSNKILQLFDIFQSKFIVGPKISKINKLILKKIKDQNYDLVFLYRAVEINHLTVYNIKKLGCKVFSYNNDDPFSEIPSKNYWNNYIKSAKFCDHNFVYRFKNVIDFENIGINNVSILKSYYLKEVNYPKILNKNLDVIFIGHYENDGRDIYIKALLDAKINIKVFGGDLWKQAPLYEQIKHIIKKPVYGKQYNFIINKSKIALVFLSKINSDTYTRRCFEITSAKTLMMSEYTDELNAMFEENKEAIYFNSKEELVNKCRMLLLNPNLIKKISDSGYKRLLKDGHSSDNRVTEILNKFINK
ncbi:MAG: hypothetical protein CMC86_05515 [Flavobacteriaceae bacterium]|nr:hypothetical protein [Flavobacteriaceae bacterium]|tara:strand:+ start:19281 stop:20306 length:1026 start_codon:yes stop_codon:yes gene_type:complete